MTGVRQSIVFQIEDGYGNGNPPQIKGGVAASYWVAAPPGSFFTSTHRRNTSRIQSMGSKFWDTVAYGTLQGTWEWTFYLDYNYPEPLFLIFEGGEETNVVSANKLVFTKNNNKRIPSFTVRRKLLNDFIGGADNEVSILKGCVVRSATFSKPSNASYVQVTMSGFYSTEELYALPEDEMDETDYTEYEGNLVEYGCLTSAELSDADIDNSSLIQNTDQVSITIDNSAEQIFSTCSAFSTEYAEGLAKITMSASSYANHPTYYKAGVYSGGERFNSIMDVLSSGEAIAPGSKGMKPLDHAYLTSYNAMARNTGGIIGQAYSQSTRSSVMHLDKVVMSSLTWQKGDGGKLVDSVSGCPVRNLDITMRTPASLPYASGPGEWEDLFFSAAPRNPSGQKTRVNNVIVEAVERLEIDGIIYEIQRSKGQATVYSAVYGKSGEVSLLDEITAADGSTFPVKTVTTNALRNMDGTFEEDDPGVIRPINITSLHIPDSIETINGSAFANIRGRMLHGTFSSMTNLTKVTMPLNYNFVSYSTVIVGGQEIGLPMDPPTEEVPDPPLLYRYYPNMFYNSTNITEFVFTQNKERGIDKVDWTPKRSTDPQYDELPESEKPWNYPYKYTPWYQSLLAHGNKEVSITWVYGTDVANGADMDLRDIPAYAFCIDKSDVLIGGGPTYKVYDMAPESMAEFRNIGSRAFYSSGLDLTGMNGTLEIEDVGSIEDWAFVNPVGLTKMKLSRNDKVSLTDHLIAYDSDFSTMFPGSATLQELDLGGCAEASVSSRALTRTNSLSKVVMSPVMSRWNSSTVLVVSSGTQKGITFQMDGGAMPTYSSSGWMTALSLEEVSGKTFVKDTTISPPSGYAFVLKEVHLTGMSAGPGRYIDPVSGMSLPIPESALRMDVQPVEGEIGLDS